MRRNVKLVLEYDGTRYDGWQKQGNTQQTIQGKLELVLEKLEGHPVEVHGSGRTDAGVHALGQVANVHLDTALSCEEIKAYLNQYLPEDIRILEAKEAGERFHSRLSAVGKTYRYYIETESKASVFQRKYVYGLGKPLDISRMREAAGYLTGTHDFKSFCSNKRMKKSTIRSIYGISIHCSGSQMEITYEANGFLYNMVRIMTGTLIEIGLGQRRPQEMKQILLECDRQAAGFTAPPEGLFLVSVDYGEKQ